MSKTPRSKGLLNGSGLRSLPSQPLDVLETLQPEVETLNDRQALKDIYALPVWARRSNADSTPITTHMPEPMSISEVPTRTGGRSGRPVT